jgi:hypothetical protein
MNRIFYIAVAAFCAIELYLAHLVDIVYAYANVGWSDLVAIEMVLIAFMGVTSKTSRQKSILAVVAGWMAWIALTDWVPVFPGWLYSIETTAFCVLIGWLILRPERLPSYLGPNVSLALYQGSRAPIIAKVLGLFGLPFLGVALVVDGNMMMPRRKVGKFIKVPVTEVSRRWTILGTPYETTPEIKTLFNSLEGQPVKGANCVSSIRPVLGILGYNSITPGTLAMEVLDGGR